MIVYINTFNMMIPGTDDVFDPSLLPRPASPPPFSFIVVSGFPSGLCLANPFTGDIVHLCSGSLTIALRIVIKESLFARRTFNVSSQHLLKTPSVPVIPMPSTISRVRRKGTRSGVGRVFPYIQNTKQTSTVLLCNISHVYYMYKLYTPAQM